MNRSIYHCTLATNYFTIFTESYQETIQIGRQLGSFLKEEDVVALSGEPGSGKTWFTKGLALGLGVSPETVVTSPSFALVNEYQGRCPFFHMDVYRLENLSDFISAGLEEYLQSGGVAAMEWADRWPEILPPQSIRVTLRFLDDHRRELCLEGSHPRSIEIIEAMKGAMRRG
ncbi:MAG: tRNA (adenosine(37)-N6)-threonylcarbamoyltransferase complex ATPase subunit type 1 TsaE [Pseudomonadota bacterium]